MRGRAALVQLGRQGVRSGNADRRVLFVLRNDHLQELDDARPPDRLSARPAAGRDRRALSRARAASRQAQRAGLRAPRGGGARAGPGRVDRNPRAIDHGQRVPCVRRARRDHARAAPPERSVTATAKVPTDIAIAQAAKLRPVADIAAELGLEDDELELYGKYKAKVRLSALARRKPRGRLVLVTGINPTPAGEGKSTVTVGVTQALRKLGKKTVICIREPSLGPVFGMKGGAAGGGYAQVVPMEDINLHFTGDFNAIALANNLLAAMLDNHILHGNELGIDVRRIAWRRVVDMNDRALRDITVSLGGPGNGYPRQDGFDIVVASEVMAIFCLSTSLDDLKERLGKIVVGYTRDQKPVRAQDLKAHGAMTVLLKDALAPNLVQTLENNPAFIHGGPFANIAHGCNSAIATQTALKLADYVVTEAGFGADLGGEKFLDIKCRKTGLEPACAVIVATMRALKMHGGVKKEDLKKEDVGALSAGMANLARHIENIQKFGLIPIVSINRFS